MGILNRYVLRQVAVPSLLAITVVAVIAVASQIQEMLSKLPMGQVTMLDLGRLVAYFLPTLVAYVLPLTYMMGILLSFGRLSQHGEIIAMKAAGIPLKRIIVPVIIVGGLLSLGCFWLQDQVQPWGMKRIYAMVFNELPARLTIDALEPGVMHEFREWHVYIGARDPETGGLRDIVVLNPEDAGAGAAAVYHAERARLVRQDEAALLVMENGYLIPPSDGRSIMPATFEKLAVRVPPLKTASPDMRREGLTIRELLAGRSETIEQYESTQSAIVRKEIVKWNDEIAKRFSLPFACLAVSFVAAPLGARAKRSGRSYTFSVGLAVALTYYVLQMLAETDSLHTLPTVVLWAWLPNILMCAAGMFAVWRVDRI